ncbi:MAG: UvrD-helicase domain-containing protein, partial [Flavobacterium sp.]
GKAEQFIELSKKENPFGNIEKQGVSLGTNYRSYSEVIEFNNAFFGFLSAKFENEDYRDLYENHSHQQTNNKKGGYVNISFIPEVKKADFGSEDEENPTKDNLYFEAVLQTIEKVKSKEFSFKDIVILTRKNGQGTLIANYLTEKGIPILSSESLLLGASTEVKVIINLLRYLNNPSDLEAKAYFLYYLANRQEKWPVHDFIAQGMEQRNESDFEQWLQDFGTGGFSFQNLRKKSLYEAVEIIISKVIPTRDRNAYVQFFLDLVLEHDFKKQAGISEFLNYWETDSEKLSIPSPEGNDAVRIMTIHKSKGLEFPVVIFPFAEDDFSKGPREKMWLNADEEVMGLPKVLVDKSSKVEGYGEEASMVYSQKKQEELLDDINVLYVALTRAEEQLYVISLQMSRNSHGNYPNNLATFFIEFLEGEGFDEGVLEYEFGNSEKLSKSKEIKDEILVVPQLAMTLDASKIKIAQRESLMWDTKQQKAIEYGNIIHEILSFVKTKYDVDLAITKAIENGLIVFGQREEVLKTIAEIVNHTDLELFFSEKFKVLNEKTIIQKEGSLVKPDRMVINNQNEIYLLDYKTGAHQPKYQQQLDNYQIAIEKMGYKVVKKTLVYIGESLEVVNL